MNRTIKVAGFAGRLINGEGPPLSRIQRVSAIFFGVCVLATGLAMVVSGISEVWKARSTVSFIICGVYSMLAAGFLWLGYKTIRNAAVGRPAHPKSQNETVS